MGMVGQPQVGVPCKFPFSISIYSTNYGTFHECTDVGTVNSMYTVLYSGTFLCATEVDDDGNPIQVGSCDPTCLSGMNNRLGFFQK